jgi:hypothetical protein
MDQQKGSPPSSYNKESLPRAVKKQDNVIECTYEDGFPFGFDDYFEDAQESQDEETKSDTKVAYNGLLDSYNDENTADTVQEGGLLSPVTHETHSLEYRPTTPDSMVAEEKQDLPAQMPAQIGFISPQASRKSPSILALSTPEAKDGASYFAKTNDWDWGDDVLRDTKEKQGQDLRDGEKRGEIEEGLNEFKTGVEEIWKKSKIKELDIVGEGESLIQGTSSTLEEVADKIGEIRTAPSTPLQPVGDSGGGCLGLFRRRREGGSERKCLIL